MIKTSFCQDWLFNIDNSPAQPVLLPHDATQLKGRSPDAPSGTGGAFYLGGEYVYAKTFIAPPHWKGKAVSLLFEGVYPTARVLLNGQEIGGCEYGYNQFEVPLSGLQYGKTNELTVQVDHTNLPDSRWYAGAGVYRPVWLLEGNQNHILHDGVRVTTLSYAPAKICVETKHTGVGQVKVEVQYQGHTVAYAWGEKAVLDIPDAQLWDAEHPNLYSCMVSLTNGDTILDAHKIPFGIRQIAWSNQGLTVNGQKVLLKGGCIHHDNGILGARTFDESEWRRIRRLKEFGFNAIRSAHNPICRAALEACDALGMYVIDESWDMWNKPKNPHDYAARFMDHYAEDLARMVAKDYNHPSVIMYSIGNEVTEPSKPEGVHLAKTLIATLKQQDTTRPVTAGINLTLLLMASMGIDLTVSGGAAAPDTTHVSSTDFNKMVQENGARMTLAAATSPADQISSPVLDLLDIAGCNYATSRYEMESTLHPDRVVVGSETYPQDLAATWKLMEKCPWVVGDFMWTAWDYLGEVGIGAWVYDPSDMGFGKQYPWKLADTGAFDILGNDTAEAGMAAVVWEARKTPYIGVCPVNHPDQSCAVAMWRGSNALPYWGWKGCEGNPARIEVYSAAEEVELFQNGVSLGKQMTNGCKALFDTVYTPGELQAVAYFSDGTQTESTLHSADPDTQIVIEPQKSAGVGDILYVDISLRGQNGEIECNADTKLKVTVQGSELLAYGSANPKTEESFLSGEYTTYYGRSLAAIVATEAKLTVTVEGEGLPTAVIIL